MADLEVCSVLAMMSDNDKVVFGRSDKFGGGTNIVVWDLLGNQPIKHMRFDAPIGNNDYVHFLALSQVRSHACNNHSMIHKSSFWHSSPVCPTLLLYSLSLPPPPPQSLLTLSAFPTSLSCSVFSTLNIFHACIYPNMQNYGI